MATDISKLPNEVSPNNVVMTVSNKSKPELGGRTTVNKKISPPVGNPPRVSFPQQSPPRELSQESISQIVAGLQQANGATSLPNRDIPLNSTHITQDEQIKPNYIPSSDNMDYIENSADMDSLIQQNKSKKTEQDRLDILYNEVQTPLLVMVLFFFFQLPYFNKMMVKSLPSLFSRDGNPSFSGYLLKTAVFGVSFYIITQATKQLSEI